MSQAGDSLPNIFQKNQVGTGLAYGGCESILFVKYLKFCAPTPVRNAGRAILFFLILSSAKTFAARSVEITWDSSPDAVVGYKVYYGQVSGVYTEQLLVGNVNIATISGLTEG